MRYTIYCGQKQIGTATVDKQGLYYCIQCSCKTECTIPYRIFANVDKKEFDLGICPPGGRITVRFPVKRVGEGSLAFYAIVQNGLNQGISVNEDLQFPYLTRLPQACLRQLDGNFRIQFKDQVSDLPDSGPSR